jgi:sulfur carrier protein
MRILLNGAARELPDGASVEGAVEASGAPASRRGVAVAVDGDVVPQREWPRTELAEGQRVEVLQAVQGG